LDSQQVSDAKKIYKTRSVISTGNLEPVIFIFARLLMGVVFLYASYDKILNPGDFAQIVYNYQILPDSLINITALVLPWSELILGICLISGFWLRGAALLGAVLMTTFTAALAYNEIRGLDVACGCFTTNGSAGPANLLTIIRDLVLLAISLYIALRVLFLSGQNKKPSTES
jgi:uncharacterized membrane protein YphA (DoxX/SURF4 family)